MDIFEGLKSAAKVLKEANKIEQYGQILDAQEKLLEMQKVIGELEKENRELKEKLETKENLTYKNGVFWDKEGGPYCPCCWDEKKKKIHMHTDVNGDLYLCKVCNNCFEKKE